MVAVIIVELEVKKNFTTFTSTHLSQKMNKNPLIDVITANLIFSVSALG